MTIPGWIVLGLAAVSDVRNKQIPVPTLVAGALAAAGFGAGLLICHNGTLQELGLSLLPGALLLLAAFFSREAVGYGDGLLLLILGPLFGWQKTFLCMPAAFFLAALVSAVLLMLKKADRKTKLPFVPFLAVAMGVVSVVF